jgi:hypothetical protein
VLIALTPPVKVANASRRYWMVNVGAFTVAGAAASALVGLGLGSAGALAGLSLGDPGAMWACLLLGLAVAAGELGPSSLPLPQATRASNGAWARRWGQPVAAVLWGVDIGLFFTTWLTFAGAWWLVAVALASGDAAFAAALFVAFWLGRALTVLLGPWLIPSATITPWVEAAVGPLRAGFRRIHVGVVLLGSALLVATPTVLS